MYSNSNIYDFINLDKNEISIKPLPNFYGNSWVYGLDKLSHKKRYKIFKLVKKINNWNKNDNVIARGYNGGIITQFSSKIFSNKIVSIYYNCLDKF